MFELRFAAADADIRRGRFAEKCLTAAFRIPHPPGYFLCLLVVVRVFLNFCGNLLLACFFCALVNQECSSACKRVRKEIRDTTSGI